MRVHLAGLEAYTKGKYQLQIPYNAKILTSFYHCNDNIMSYFLQTVNINNILLDSGAFTYRTSFKDKHNTTFDENLKEYVENYIKFINKYNIQYFFEMDIDTNKEEYEKIKDIRKYIEESTNKKCIPVFHYTRGIDNWYELCENYDYIAIGGVAGNFEKDYYIIMKKLVNYANKHNVKVHGLGYTTKNSKNMGFYSVDSTSWNGIKYGMIYKYNYDKLPPKVIKKEENKKLKQNSLPIICQHNFNEWYKYQQDLLKEEYLNEKGIII